MFSVVLLLAFLQGTPAAPAPTFAAVTSAPKGQYCFNQTISLKQAWSMPLTLLAGSQSCTMQFAVPLYNYAVLDIFGTGFGDKDQLGVYDGWDDFIFRSTETTFANRGAWPSSFTVVIRTGTLTSLQLSMNITVVKTTPLVNVAPTQKMAPEDSQFLWFDSWPAGMSYQYTADQGGVRLFGASLTGNISHDSEFKNIFVYRDGSFVGTLVNLMQVQSNMTFNTLLLYAPLQPQIEGAVMITHSSNIAGLNSYHQFYTVPFNQPMMKTSFSLFSSPGMDGAATIIGAMDGSTPITVTSLESFWDIPAAFSVMNGGPMTVHSGGMALTNSSLPKKLNGNVWTFYATGGSGKLYISM